MTSKRQQNAGYLLPTPVTGYDTICLTLQIPNVREYRAAVVGHLYQLANWWTWEKSYIGSDTRARDAAAMFRRLLVDTLMLQECGSGGTPVVSNPGCVPIGSPFMLFVNVAPEGALPMDGVARLQADYPDLMPMIPASWKSGNNFTLPNMASRGLFGAGSVPGFAASAGQTFGEVAHTLTEAELPPHVHRQKSKDGVDLWLDNGFTGWNTAANPGAASNATGELNTGSTGGGVPHNNMPPAVAGYWFIQATNCESAAAGDFDIRLSGCLLEYTLNGSMWFVVDGWTNLDNCLNIPLPFDLRFNNCLLEYSRDSAQTWDTVPGWEVTETCFAGGWGPEDFNMRVEGGILQYTEDGGDTWNNVFAWNTLQDDFLRERDRCVNAWGSAYGLKELVGNFAVHLLYDTDLPTFRQSFVDEWAEQFVKGALEQPLPTGIDAWCNSAWSASDHTELFDQISGTDNVSILAGYIYSAVTDGDWCEGAITGFQFYECRDVPLWATLIMMFVKMMFDTDEYWQRQRRAQLVQMSDYGTCQDCTPLTEFVICPTEPAPFACETDFSVSVIPWTIFYDVGAVVSTDDYGWKAEFNANGGWEFIIERSLPDGALSIASLSKAQFTGGLVSATHRIYARIGSTWTQIVSEVEYTSNQEVNLSASLPVGADAVRMSVRLDNTTVGTVWINSITVSGEALENPC